MDAGIALVNFLVFSYDYRGLETFQRTVWLAGALTPFSTDNINNPLQVIMGT